MQRVPYLVPQVPICYEKLVVESCLAVVGTWPIKTVNMDYGGLQHRRSRYFSRLYLLAGLIFVPTRPVNIILRLTRAYSFPVCLVWRIYPVELQGDSFLALIAFNLRFMGDINFVYHCHFSFLLTGGLRLC
ncbi:hypothetical protein ES707_22314 [subsurface metagenome]